VQGEWHVACGRIARVAGICSPRRCRRPSDVDGVRSAGMAGLRRHLMSDRATSNGSPDRRAGAPTRAGSAPARRRAASGGAAGMPTAAASRRAAQAGRVENPHHAGRSQLVSEGATFLSSATTSAWSRWVTSDFCYCFADNSRGSIVEIYTDGVVCRGRVTASLSQSTLGIDQPALSCGTGAGLIRGHAKSRITCHPDANGVALCDTQNLGRMRFLSKDEKYRRAAEDQVYPAQMNEENDPKAGKRRGSRKRGLVA
jgi:hypothetical protein